MARWAVALAAVMAGGVAATAVGASPAASARTLNLPKSVNLTLSGSLAITWQGDPTRGCAAEGLCGVRGELILRSYGSSGIGSSGPLSELPIGLSGTVRVRDDAQSPPGECVDLVGNPEGAPGPALLLTQRRSWTAVLSPAASSARCAGPLASDLARLSLPVKVGAGRYPIFDLHGTQAFAAGPFSGSAASTMVVRTAPGNGGSGGSFTESFSSDHGSTRRFLTEFVDLRYRVSFGSSTLGASFAGVTDPLCQALDSCQTTGSEGVTVNRGPTTIALTASRSVRSQVSAPRALEDLRAGRLTIDSPVFAAAPAELAESLQRSDGSPCSEALAISGLQIAFGPATAPPTIHALPISLLNEDSPAIDVLRTHCPGPAEADVTGASGILAATSLEPRELLAQTQEISLTNPGGFSGLGYNGDRSGAVKLHLTLTHVTAGTRAQRP
jgi:hypothetical protein